MAMAINQKIKEEAANCITHGFVVPFAVMVFLDMQKHTNSIRERYVILVYCGALLLLFMVSALYHFFGFMVAKYGNFYSSIRRFLRVLDFSMIHLFIAASYTPWLLLHDNGPLAEHVCKLVWICAIICIIVQNLPFTLIQTEHFFITSYLVLGVLPATFICAAATDIYSLFPLAVGGVLYIAGLLFYFSEHRIRFAHAIWHVFVCIGAYIHYRALDNYLIREGERQRMALSNSSWWHSWLPFCWDYNNCV